MKKPRTKISRNLYNMLRSGVGMAGSYDPAMVFPYIEECLTFNEVEQCEAFLTWVVDNDLTFGWNLDEVWANWVSTL